MLWPLIDCLTDDELKALVEYHLTHHPGEPLWGMETKKPPPVTVRWEHPVEGDVGKSMSQVVGEISPIRTEGI